MHLKRLVQIGLALCLQSALPCVASDEKREALIAVDIQKKIKTGNVMWLQAGDKPFLSLYTPVPIELRKGLVILVHDMGGNPDQATVIQKLRQIMPSHHWAVLSIQMPLRELGASMEDYEALLPQAKQRFTSTLDFAQSEKVGKVIVVGYGLGALMTTYALADHAAEVNGVILISLPVTESSPSLAFISNFHSPMLDVYAESDIPEVLRSANERLFAAKQNVAYRQVKIENEGHQYLNDTDMLLKLIYGWADRMVANVSPAGPLRPKEVTNKVKGEPGTPGPKGDQGVTGSRGEQGIEGIQGVKGSQGEKGETGERGLQGLKGETGVQGLKGDAGAGGGQGLQGAQGTQGPKGDMGAKGEAGPKGEQGIKGNQGLKGSRGDAGFKGEKGVKGELGPKGEQGLKGDAGPQGDQGIKGGTGLKGDSGSQGDIGPQGDRGIKGDSGPKGETGIKGDQGIKGDTGPKGSVGPKGDRGIKGDSGP